ncbi:MAG: hypothetical protein RTV41_05310 [Candidatus Thorarchaeota archaeon]
MKRKLVIGLLLVLLILSIMPLYRPYVVDSGVFDSPRNPSLIHETSSDAESNVTFTWTSRWQTEPQDIINGSSIAGDHIVINGSWNVPVTNSQITIRSGFNETREGTIPEPGTTYELPANLNYPQDFVWETFDGIHSGDDVRVFLNLTPGGDPSFYVFHWRDSDYDQEVDLNELGDLIFSMDDDGFEISEAASFKSPLSQPIAIRVYCWNYAYSENMTYALQVDTRDEVVIESEPESPSEILFDTYCLFRNITTNITLSATHDSDVMSIVYIGISLANYFSPIVNMHPPVRLDVELPYTFPSTLTIPVWPILQGRYNLSWTCYDLNANDTNYYSVWLSDDGVTFLLFQQNLTETFFVWDSTGYVAMDHIYRVRAYSLDFTTNENDTSLCSTDNPPESYWPGDYADSSTDGWQSTRVITPSTTVTTTTSNIPQLQDDTLLFVTAGVGVIVVIILFVLLIRKK